MPFLQLYHHLLSERGVREHPFETCLDDHRLLLPEGFFRMVFNASYFNLTPEQERAHLDVYGARFLQAIRDLNAGELLPSFCRIKVPKA